MKSTLIGLLSLVLSATGLSAKSPALYGDRTVSIDSIITLESVAQITNALYSYSRNPGGKEVTILLNSPGGEVRAGLQVIEAMKAVQATGTTISCVLTGPTASMAAWIYAHCNDRYMVPQSLLLYHFTRIILPRNAIATASDLVGVAKQLLTVDKQMFGEVLQALQIDPNLLFLIMAQEAWLNPEIISELTGKAFATVYIPSKRLMDRIADSDTPKTSSVKVNLFGYETPPQTKLVEVPK